MSQPEENESLHEAMKNMAKARDQATRQRMYRQLLRAYFYIPTRPEAEGSAIQSFEQDDPLQGFPVYVAFTQPRMMTRWKGGETSHTVLRGTELFPILSGSKIGSLLINPKGSPRGELYRNEVSALADAAPRYQAWLDRRKKTPK